MQWAAIIGVAAAVITAGCGGSSTATTQPSSPASVPSSDSGPTTSVAAIDTATTELSNPQPRHHRHHHASWKSDPSCSLTSLLVTEVKWMDDGTIPDNAKNESSAHVLAVIRDAQRAGGSCDDVIERMLRALL